MSAGLCSVLQSIRGSMDSDSDSDNDHDVTDDVDPPSWHGSMQHLTSTSESETGNCSSESFLCDHCGKHSIKGDNNSSNNSNHSRTSGRPPFPSGRKRALRPKKRAHFAVDTDNSSDNADKMSDSHESSPCSTTFKPISGPSQMVLATSRRGSLSPREIKPASSTDNHHHHHSNNNNRPTSSFTRSYSLTATSDRGRQPFKANHELFKLPPSGSSASASATASAMSSSSSSPSASRKSAPALPPRQINRNHFKLQRRNSMSNEDRGKFSLRKTDGDLRPQVRSASATRELNGGKNYETDTTTTTTTTTTTSNFETKPSNHRVTFSTTTDSDTVSSKDRHFNHHQFSAAAASMVKDDNSRQLPNYDEAVQRVSLLRWASLQKLPSKSTNSGEHHPHQHPSSSGDDASPINDLSPAKIFGRSSHFHNSSSSSSSRTAKNGYVEQRVRRFEENAICLSSESNRNSSSVEPDRLSSSWNSPASMGGSSVNSDRNTDWVSRHAHGRNISNSTGTECTGKSPQLIVTNTNSNSTQIVSSSSSSVKQNAECGGGGGGESGSSSIFRLRRDDSSTLSDDVFAHDDSRENFADISWSPVILSEDRSDEKNTFLTPAAVPPLPPKRSATASPSRSLPPPLPESYRQNKSTRGHHRNGPINDDSRHSVSWIDRNSSSGGSRNVFNRRSVSGDIGVNTRNNKDNNNPGDNNNKNNNNNNNNNSPPLQTGKRIVLEVLV